MLPELAVPVLVLLTLVPKLVDPLRGSLVFKPINHATEKASPTPRPRYYNVIH